MAEAGTAEFQGVAAGGLVRGHSERFAVDDVEGAGGIGLVVIQRGGNFAGVQAQNGNGQFEGAAACAEMAEITFWRCDGDIVQYGMDCLGFVTVVGDGAEAMRIDVVDVGGL